MVSAKEKKEAEAKAKVEAEKKKLEEEKKENSKSSKLDETILELSREYPFLFKAFCKKLDKPIKEKFKTVKQLNDEFDKFRGE